MPQCGEQLLGFCALALRSLWMVDAPLRAMERDASDWRAAPVILA
jgi:hypothetical protein